jgi:hypothetical protein
MLSCVTDNWRHEGDVGLQAGGEGGGEGGGGGVDDGQAHGPNIYKDAKP